MKVSLNFIGVCSYFGLSLSPSSTLDVLTYPLILSIIKTYDLIALSKYPIKYLELVFVLTNFEITMLSKLTP